MQRGDGGDAFEYFATHQNPFFAVFHSHDALIFRLCSKMRIELGLNKRNFAPSRGVSELGKNRGTFSDLEMFPRSGAELHFPDDQMPPIAENASGKFGSGKSTVDQGAENFPIFTDDYTWG